jgi:outer membrane protein assembly factor BamD (BamD/ComL family)
VEKGIAPDPRIEIDNEVDEAYNRGVTLLREGEHEQAETLYKDMKVRFPSYPDSLYLQVQWAEATENWQLAVEACDALVQFKSPDVEITPEGIADYSKKTEYFRGKMQG